MTSSLDPQQLDSIFEAFGNQHRREIIYALGLQPHSISRLAQLQKLSLPAIHKHIKALKKAGLIRSRKLGRTQFLTINRQSFLHLQTWLMQYQVHWGNDDETLENYATYLQKKNTKGGLPLDLSPRSSDNFRAKGEARPQTGISESKLRKARLTSLKQREAKGGEKKK
jgi:DNA-binding transcriptional ArsR family regulator